MMISLTGPLGLKLLENFTPQALLYSLLFMNRVYLTLPPTSLSDLQSDGLLSDLFGGAESPPYMKVREKC